ncbi:hypothetical protein CC85DRAFT_276393 [Cutaneotrichosporon oleaginosum]|uniref:Uncharacterized protein n=1 Tax=Cutaneotrichosporon oleaginosum TaxID=879819 RepID=A0A0J0XJG4_9TREE|nr:uncharacterized protein CC85DRAFT_276393 [Cutaneotrichosporon oleaginosum]KLT41223.1 hypothetical protein CC85DRAFT_276393 [Cutaneotrichosporon oleaginosum]TXT05488.1 hypothetical protein COLE_06808 [Cutaneotrichosporon oleaginosum]
MPTETADRPDPPLPATLKCAECGAASLGPTDGVIILGETMERVCAACVRARGGTHAFVPGVPPPAPDLDLDISGLRVSPQRAVVIDLAAASRLRPRCRRDSTPTPSPASSSASLPVPSELQATAMPVPARTPEAPEPADPQIAKSLPAARTSPWGATTAPRSVPTPLPAPAAESGANPLLDVGRARLRSDPRGCLYPGAIFKGTQRSGRSAYDVEIRLLEVNFAQSTCCGYLTIANLTDTHPELTTFFDGEIIGPKYGFITGARFGATEVDDRRHWERFEPYLRASTKADLVRPEMLLRDPLPNISRGETQPRERDFVFLRIKEKFLVPDHTVRDISGASFAGFYYAMVDMAPTDAEPDWRAEYYPTRTARRPSSGGVARPDAPRRMSSTTLTARRVSTSGPRPEAGRRMSSSRAQPPPPEPTLRGYYFHSLNNEFQELFLRHVPSTSAGTFELR